MKKLFLISVLLLLSIVAVACGGDDGDNENGENANESENENTEQTENAEGENNEGQQEVEEVKADEFPDVVAKVNGEEITNEQLALNVNAIQQQYQMYGMNIDENKEGIQQTALDQLINTEVIEQSAKKTVLKHLKMKLNQIMMS